MVTIGRNITHYMRIRQLSLPKLALKAGMDKGNLYRIVKTGKGYSSDSLERIAVALGVMIADLFAETPSVSQIPSGIRRVPVLTAAQVGAFAGIAPYFRDSEMQEYIMTSFKYSEKTFAMVVEGDSMAPDLNAGDTVIVDPDLPPRPGNFVVAVGASGLATIKKYAERGHDAQGRDVFELIPTNPLYAGVRSDLDAIRIIGVARERNITLL